MTHVEQRLADIARNKEAASLLRELASKPRPMHGENNPNSIFTVDQVRTARALYAAGKKPKQIWRLMGLDVSYDAYRLMLYGKTWAHV